LQVPDCPNAAVLAARLAELADARPDLTVTYEIVTTAHGARRRHAQFSEGRREGIGSGMCRRRLGAGRWRERRGRL
jgi:hypothetical protein